jgi:hypothetical protein
MVPFLISIFLTISSPDSKADKHESVEFVYEAFIGSKSIGELSAVRRRLADSVVYLITSDIDARIGFRLVQDYKLESVYRNGTLNRSEIYNVVNDKVRADTRIHWEGDRYVAFRGDSMVLDQEPVDFSIVRLFFKEPKGMQQVFSENFAQDLECNPEKSDWLNKYCLVLPDRTRIFYYYDEGVCEQFEVNLFLFNVRYNLKRVQALP